MISQTMQQIFNQLIQVDLNSAYFYLAIANYFERMSLKGFSVWLQAQHDEELTHAHGLIRYLLDRGGVPVIPSLPQQPVNFGTPLQAWEVVLQHERYVTNMYQKGYNVALQQGDTQSQVILQTALVEQVDEEAQTTDIIGKLKLVEGMPGGILMVDREVGGLRQVKQPVAAPAG
ncbi:ferritin [Heliobacillus mobilis]|uniref:Ferritin n=1 Tax=Heliobacterium mobile TaxID=28064 RepID=A0A6I3SFS2_HELMO|nr:ferritin [Heliobacterium mobile]MTV47886.1 ferritin [Heliobacterium mobile]